MKIEVGKTYLYERILIINGIKKPVKTPVEVVDFPDSFSATIKLEDGRTIDVERKFLHLRNSQKPTHYDTSIDTIDFMKANFSREAVEGFMRGNAIKYLQRIGKGEKLSDLKKAEAYIKMLIELEEEQ